MKPFLAYLALLLPFAARADQLTATLIDQTFYTSAQVHLPDGSACYSYGLASTSCSIGGVTAGANINGAVLSAYGEIGLIGNSGAEGFAQLSGTVDITGGSGTGYLEILPTFSGPDQVSAAFVGINNQGFFSNNGGGFGWLLIPFTLGQPINYTYSVLSGYVTATLLINDVRVYGHEPSGCVIGAPCTDPDYLDVTNLFIAVPEPATIWIAGLGLSGVTFLRRFVRGHARKV